jgi:hypothetical protein
MPDAVTNPNPDPHEPRSSHVSASEHVGEAQQLLKRLRQKIQDHPELDAAIERLELALADLNVSTGGML